MTRRQDDDNGLELGAQDRRLFDALGEAYRPPPLTPAGRAAIRRGVERRLERRRRPGVLVPGLGAAAVAAVAAWLVFVTPAPPPSPGDEMAPFLWEEQLFFSNDLTEKAPDAETEYLPDDYEAMSAYFLEL
jgi:hypothetical protein